MARDPNALLNQKWASSGDTETPESAGLTRSEGWPLSYSQAAGDKPERTVFNGLFEEITAMLVELNQNGGCLVWEGTTLDYKINAGVKGSDNILYFATQVSGPATTPKDPTDAGNRPAFWVSFDEKVANSASTVPVGTIAAFPTLVSIPSDYLIANGSSFVEATYPSLFIALGNTTTLPDYRGEFLRGSDQGRGVDTGRVIGSSQSDEFASHSHTYNRAEAGGLVSNTGSSNNGGNVATSVTGGTETRPRNVAIIYAIKAEQNNEKRI